MRTHGTLSDHYNPVTKKLALSETVYDQPSVAAIGVAYHEAGHAIQHAEEYAPLWLRSVLVPTANIGSSLGYILMIAGLFMGMMKCSLIGAVMFSMVLLFQVVTLPVEFDASARAKSSRSPTGMVLDSEREGMGKVLNAAALTYVAAAISTLMTLLYFLMRAGLLGGVATDDELERGEYRAPRALAVCAEDGSSSAGPTRARRGNRPGSPSSPPNSRGYRLGPPAVAAARCSTAAR